MTVTEAPRDPRPKFGSAAERGLATPRAAGVAGIVFAVLFFIGLALLAETVGVALDTQTVMDNLSGSGSTPALVGLYMVPFAGIAFLWFFAVVRDRIGAHEASNVLTTWAIGPLPVLGMPNCPGNWPQATWMPTPVRKPISTVR